MGTPKYRNTAELEAKIEAYFTECDAGNRPPTPSGLALALGFDTAEALKRYRGKAQNREAVARALTRLSSYAEERLMNSGAGAKYVLDRGLGPVREDDDGAADVLAEVRRRLRRRDEG